MMLLINFITNVLPLIDLLVSSFRALITKPVFDYALTQSAVFKYQDLINSLLQKDVLSSNTFHKTLAAS